MTDTTTDFHFPNVTLVITDKDGKAAKVDGAPIWASSDETVISVVAAVDGMSAVVETVAPGTARVTVSADADLGAGSTIITGVTDDIVVGAGVGPMASIMKLDLGAPVLKA